MNETILVEAHTFRDNQGVEFVRTISTRKTTKANISLFMDEKQAIFHIL